MRRLADLTRLREALPLAVPREGWVLLERTGSSPPPSGRLTPATGGAGIPADVSKDRGWQLALGLTALGNMFIELYADCTGSPVDSVIRDAAALAYDEPPS